MKRAFDRSAIPSDHEPAMMIALRGGFVTAVDRTAPLTLWLVALCLLLTGCGTPPRGATTDFTVFTPLHLKVVELATSATSNHFETTAHMQRFFGSTLQEYAATERRMDRMLERSQVATAARQARASEWGLNLTAGTAGRAVGDAAGAAFRAGAGGAGSGAPDLRETAAAEERTPAPTTKPADEADEPPDQADATATKPSAPRGGNAATTDAAGAMQDAFRRALERLGEEELVDSPFDTLDRVTDFYAAYSLKYLRGQADSRAVDTHWLEQIFARQVATPLGIEPPTEHPEYRLLTLVLQTQVDTGNRPNLMTAVRIGLTDEDGRPVQILRLHPTRTYDLDSTLFADEARSKLRLSGSGQTSPELSMDVQRGAESEEQVLKRFYSRVGKVTSYADASQGVFGWTFYPANLRLLRTSLSESAYRWLVGTPAGVKVRGFVEGGGRDSFVVVLVPWKAQQLQARVSTKHAKMKPDGSGYELFTRWTDHRWSRTFSIPLPKPSLWEPLAATPGLTRSALRPPPPVEVPAAHP